MTYYGSDAWGKALAIENAQVEDEPLKEAQKWQTQALANDMVAPVSERYRTAVYAAKMRLQAAERAVTLAKQQVTLRIRMERPELVDAQQWTRDALRKPNNEVQDATAALAAAELALGQQVQARRALEAFTATEAQEHAFIDDECAQRHAALNATRRRLLAAIID